MLLHYCCTISGFYYFADVSNIDKPAAIPGFIGKTTLPALKCTVHEQDDGTIVAVCATGKNSYTSHQ